MGDERERPPSTRVGAIADLQAGVDMTEGGALAAVALPRRTPVAHRLDATRLTGERGPHHDACAVLELADHLVAGDEREADDGLEVPRAVTVDRRQVRPADASQPWPHP